MQEKLLSLLKEKSYTKTKLIELFGEDVLSILDELIKLGEIVEYRRSYAHPSVFNVIVAQIVSIKDGFSFARHNEEDYYIPNKELNGAFLDDIVLLKLIDDFYQDRYRVIKVIKRERNKVVGELKRIRNKFYLLVKDIAPINFDFIVENSSISLVPNALVLAEISSINPYFSCAYVKPIEVLGFKGDPGIDITRIVLSSGAPVVFPQSVIDEVKQIPDHVLESELEGRTDFRNNTIVTIDGEDARDFDDAVEVTYKNGLYHVGVHIADVSHYVKEDSPLDKEAELRSTSIYASDRVIPMLPFELSNGICSLNPNVDRLVQSVLFAIDRDGNIVSSSIHKGVIKSKARLTYTYVNNVLKTGEIDTSLPKEVNRMIPLLKEVADIIRERRNSFGSIDLESTELKFKMLEDGTVYDVEKRVQDVGENLIEDLMIQANEIIGYTISNMEKPFVYRIHEDPKAKKMDEFKKLSAILGYPSSIDSLNVTPMETQMHMNGVDDEKKRDILSSYLLRAMAKARYSPINKGHFGLALEYYSHYTSPIRRYPDLLAHRLIDNYLFNIGKKKSDDVLLKELFFLTENASIREKRAQNVERTIDDLLSAKYLKDLIGSKFDGTVISMTSNGMFVELENGIDGYLPFENMTGYFDYRPDIFMATSKGKTYKLGDSIKVRLVNVDIEKAKITFSLINEQKSSNIISKKGGKKHAPRRNKNRHK